MQQFTLANGLAVWLVESHRLPTVSASLVSRLGSAADPADLVGDRAVVGVEAEARLAALTKPTIAMVQGPCIGGGCGLAVACDLRFSDTTGRFGITPANLGLVYSLPATKRLVDLVGPARAKYILFSGRHVPAERALEIGLVDELFEPHELADAVTAFAETVASRAQFSVRSTKRMVHLIMAGQTADNEETRKLRLDSFATDDYREGVRAFLEKRDPRFTYA